MGRLASKTFLCCLLFLVFTRTTGQQSQCEDGWFGDKCQYLCHCLNDAVCDKVTGECPGVCDKGWFGPQCQYGDAAFSNNTIALTDGDDSTCLTGPYLTQDFPFLQNVKFTWMRIVTSKPGLFGLVTMTFTSSSGAEVAPKSQLTKIYVSDTILELHGEFQDRIKSIKLHFDTQETKESFCTMQVSSGCNVAIKQKASQTSTYLGGAEKAVDGKTSLLWNGDVCSSTEQDDNPYWTLDLSLPVTVNMYTLIGATDSWVLCRLRHFRLESYFQSTHVQQFDKTGTVDLYNYVYSEDTSPITSVTLTVSRDRWPNNYIDCDVNRISLSFCEIQIFGDVECQPRKWGRVCEKDCNCQDPSESCFVSTGMCPSGCKAGLHGPGCQEECLDGRWGVDCLNSCGNCLNENCNKMSGDCRFGCIPGFKVPHCVEKCDPTYYGEGCAHLCSDKCIDQMCHYITGVCDDCPDGIQQSKDCSKECDPGSYGYNCNKACPSHCLNNLCDTVDGTCTKCVAGYQGPKCEQECDSGFYGYNCSQTCPTICLNDMCDNVEGSCAKCPAGYQGPLCDRECADGQWGISCLNSCDKCLNRKCNKISGECLSGCVQGYNMPFCVQECDLGFHGYNCIDSCPENCQNKNCNNVDGFCIECEAGYLGPLCSQVCDAKLYGQNCATPCSEMCVDELCHYITGVCEKCPYGKQISKDCSQDCDGGSHGYNCLQSCPANCRDNKCDNVDGTCIKCVAGYQGLVCKQECDATFYGVDCATQCSDSCIDQLCHHITGVCDNCPDGKEISKDCSQDADQLNLVIILVPVILVLIVVAALIVGTWFWRKRKAQKTKRQTSLNNENKNGPDVVHGHGVHLVLKDIQPPNVPEVTIDHYDRISLNVNEGNPDNNEHENTSRYVNVENPALNEYERTGENRESHVYTEPDD